MNTSDRDPGGPPTALGDYVDELVTAFRQRLEHLDREDPKLLPEAFQWNERDELTEDERDEYGPSATLARCAVDAVIGPVLWHRELGPLLDTSDVTHRLGITRQAVALRVLHHSLLGLPGRRSRQYPMWQFGGPEGVWPIVPVILRRWYQAEPEVEPVTIALWANTPSSVSEETSVRPAHLISQGDRDDLVLAVLDDTIARRTR